MKIRALTLSLLLLAGCSTYSSTDPETTRGVVLKYINTEVGTTGPFSKRNPKDLEILSDADRAQAMTLLNRGAVGFVIFGGSQKAGSETGGRIVLVQDGKVVGDYWAAAK